MLSRRFLIASVALLPLSRAALAGNESEEMIAQIEKRAGGRLGVAVLDTQTGRRADYRADERFPMCSTFKLLAVSAVLTRVDRGLEKLDRRIAYTEADLLDYAPITRAHVGEGAMTVVALCAAAIQWSDNTAANLLLATLGGPAGVTRYVRSLGDPVTRLDRNEPTANICIPGDPRDTTTPAAMLADLKLLTLGRALSEASRARLITWLVNYSTPFARIPAGLPAGWMSGNKTGTGANGTANDIAIVWPPGRAPMLMAVYYTGSTAPADARDGAIADVARIVSRMPV
jgi:beta-lactamase class A